MPVVIMLLGAFVLFIEGLTVAIIAFIIPGILINEMSILAMKVFGVMGVVLLAVGWVLDRFDH